MHINLKQLRTFFLAARAKNITQAAETLCVTQPAVTMQIKSLEHMLSMKLIRKYGKDFQLTEVGDVLFDFSEKIFDIVEEMEQTLKSYTELAQGSLRLGTTQSFARYFMPDLISRFQDQYPKVKVFLKGGSSQEIAEGILSFKYDLGLIGSLPIEEKLKVIPFKEIEFFLVIPPRHRFASKNEISLQDLRDEPVIIREEGSGSRRNILSLFQSHGINPSVHVETGNVEFIKEYVMQGEGISFLSEYEAGREVNMGLLMGLRIKESPIFLKTYVVFHKDMELSLPARAFLLLTEKGSPVDVMGSGHEK